MERIEAVLFDWGGVLIDDPAPGLMAYCAKKLGVSVEDYTRVHSRHSDPFQKGLIEEATFWQRVCSDLKRPTRGAASLWGQALRAIHTPRKDVLDLVRQLRDGGYKTAILSNAEAAAKELSRQPRYRVFDLIVLSCAVGTSKPEREIYEITARRLETPPEQCVFIDDRPAFVAGAVAVGMKGILYRDLAQLVKDLADLGVRVDGEPDPGTYKQGGED